MPAAKRAPARSQPKPKNPAPPDKPPSRENSKQLQRGHSQHRLRPQGSADLRRNQLLDVAAAIIEKEGVEALRPARLAELAGCARTLVYRYFPRRVDLLIGVTASFYEHLDERLSRVDQVLAISGRDLAATRKLHVAIWDLIEEMGTAAPILRASPEFSEDFAAYLQTVRARYDSRWLEGYVALGASPTQASILNEIAISTTKTLAHYWLRGEISRDEAVEMGTRTQYATVRATLNVLDQAG
jgi:AcrR family transcriptional regulator